MQRFGVGIAVTALVIAGLWFIYPRHDAPVYIEAAGQRVAVVVADTDAERARGLGGSEALGEDEGMLFIFDSSGQYGFWMKDMGFAIDIVWLDEAGRVVHIAAGVRPESYPTVFENESPARYVLELPEGWTERHQLSIGDTVAL